MMEPVHRLTAEPSAAVIGKVRLDPIKLLWTGGMISGALLLAPFYTNFTAVFTGLSLTYVTLLLGHSVGMHRMMIHRSFKAKAWLQYLLLYLGTLVGIGGPSAVIKIHDTRDEPKVEIESELANDLFVQHLDRFWRLHQFGFGIVLFLIGGMPFVVWGVFFRVAISTIGHWTITYICHNPGPGHWDVVTSGVQASDVKLPGWIGGWLTHGECWHSNHHAFPESARIGIYPGQIDPAAWIIEKLNAIGLVYDVEKPREAISDLRRRTPLSKSQKL